MTASWSLVGAPTCLVKLEVSGVLFDTDGVLVRSISGDEQCWIRWAERHRLTESFDIGQTHGRRAVDTIRTYFPSVTEAELAANVEELDSFAEEEQLEVTAYPGAGELLRFLPLIATIVTSAPERMMRSRLAARSAFRCRQASSPATWLCEGSQTRKAITAGRRCSPRSRTSFSLSRMRRQVSGQGRRPVVRCLRLRPLMPLRSSGEADWIVASLDQIAFAITDSGTLKVHFIQADEE